MVPCSRPHPRPWPRVTSSQPAGLINLMALSQLSTCLMVAKFLSSFNIFIIMRQHLNFSLETISEEGCYRSGCKGQTEGKFFNTFFMHTFSYI